MRCTGRLHLGHYQGVLKTWLKIQAQSRCFFFAADWHALTTQYEAAQNIAVDTLEMIIDWLAVGLDPEQALIFVQSHIPEHAELHVLLSMITPLGWLERIPTYKDQQEALKEKQLATYGFLGYPVLQTADILAYGLVNTVKTLQVPMGEDQLAHLEFTRELVRRFNHLYGSTFVEPQPLLSAFPKVPGLDGRKMSKSYGNTLPLRADPTEITQKIKTMPTDPARVRRHDPGDPEKCPVWALHQMYSTVETQGEVNAGCRSAALGCVDCKSQLTQALLAELEPLRQRACVYEKSPDLVHDILKTGAAGAREVAGATLAQVRRAIGLRVL
jgi:tryptophanyl-tRNA synthetase